MTLDDRREALILEILEFVREYTATHDKSVKSSLISQRFNHRIRAVNEGRTVKAFLEADPRFATVLSESGALLVDTVD